MPAKAGNPVQACDQSEPAWSENQPPYTTANEIRLCIDEFRNRYSLQWCWNERWERHATVRILPRWAILEIKSRLRKWTRDVSPKKGTDVLLFGWLPVATAP